LAVPDRPDATDRGPAPLVSVVVPALDAAAALGASLDGLDRQTSPRWEALVVDAAGGETAGIVGSAAARDGRIRRLQGGGRGVGEAVNLALAHARGEWVLVHHADELLEPCALEALLARVAGDPALGAAYGGWARVDSAGRVLTDDRAERSGDLFDLLAVSCPFALHSCLVRRVLVEEVGGFDPALETAGAWDLWQRIARAGARFGAVRERVGRRRVLPESRSSGDGARILRDGLEVVARGHAPDPRVPRPDSRHADGRPAELADDPRIELACLGAGVEIGRRRDPRRLLELIGDARAASLDPQAVVARLVEGVSLARAIPPASWPEDDAETDTLLDGFLAALEERVGVPRLAAAARRRVERERLAALAPARPARLGRTWAIDIELAEAVVDASPPAGCDRLDAALYFAGEPLGSIELPVCDGLVPAAVIADAAASRHGWELWRRFVEPSLTRHLLVSDGLRGHVLRRGGLTLAAGLPADRERAIAEAHERCGWTLLLQELWGCRTWGEGRFYDAAARRSAGRMVPPCRPVDGWIAVEPGEAPCDVAAGEPEARARLTIGGAPVAIACIAAAGDGTISHAALRAALCAAAGPELCTAAVREGVVGRPLDDPASLRERLADAAGRRGADRAAPSAGRGDALVLPRRPGRAGTSVSRRAALPAGAAAELLAAARACEEGALAPAADTEPAHARYAPELAEALEAPPRAGVGDEQEGASHLPILMYHRVTDAPSRQLARYSTSPSDFAEQLSLLARAGYVSATLDEWADASLGSRPLAGRRVLITFDDGHRDFATRAWPLLQEHGFGAILFVVAGRVGGTADWEIGDDRTPLLGWNELAALRDEGVELGSHTLAHARLPALDAEAAVRELASSRAVLAERLGEPIEALAYPYGDLDAPTTHLAGGCGYVYGLTCEGRRAVPRDDLLALPRLEVPGGIGLQRFAGLVDGTALDPEPA